MSKSHIEVKIEIKIEIMQSIRDGLTVTEASQKYDVSRQSIYKFIKCYEAGGVDNLRSKSSARKNNVNANLETIEIIRTMCLQRPDASALELKSIIEKEKKIVIGRSTISRHLNKLNLIKPLDKVNELEHLYRSSLDKLNEYQMGFLIKHNQSYIDRKILNETSNIVKQIGYFSLKTETIKEQFICICIDARTGYLAVEITNELNSRVFASLLSSSLKSTRIKPVTLCIVNKKRSNIFSSLSVYSNILNLQEDKIIILHNCDDISTGGMFKRFENSLRKMLMKAPEIKERLLFGDAQQRSKIITVIRNKWQESFLNGYPRYGKPPFQMTSTF